MPKQSAGILLYRQSAGSPGVTTVEVLLAHPGGPFFSRKDRGCWTIPKGEYDDGEAALVAAEREFLEEIGSPVPPGARLDLGEVRQASGKRVRAYAVEGDLEPENVSSNLFEMEWPPSSGQMEWFPEVDRAEWFPFDEAIKRLNPAQVPFVERLADRLS